MSVDLDDLRVLSIRQPWASLIIPDEATKRAVLRSTMIEMFVVLPKRIENRSSNTSHRGLTLIHASKKVDPHAMGAMGMNVRDFQLGVILGSVDLVDCVRDYPSYWAEPDKWHWVMDRPQAFSKPIPFKGGLGLIRARNAAPETFELIRTELTKLAVLS